MPPFKHDVPTLAEISARAFETDTNTRLKALPSGVSHATDMIPALVSWVSSPERCHLLKAVSIGDSGEQEIAGWACRAFKNIIPPLSPVSIPDPSSTHPEVIIKEE